MMLSDNQVISAVPMEIDQNPFAMAPQLGEKDFISNLPDDCLFFVFSFLDWDSFEVMERINQRMYAITRDKQCVKPIDEFIIFKSDSRFTVYANPLDKSDSCLVYETSSDENGAKRKIKALREGYLPNSPEIPENSEIPQNLFAALESLHFRCKAKKMFIYELYVDDSFLRRLGNSFNWQIPSNFLLMNVITDEKTKFAEFILESRINNLDISWTSFPSDSIQAQFNEDFFIKFSCFNNLKNRRLRVDCTCNENRWILSRAILPLICRYSELELHSLVLPIDLLPELINMYFNSIVHTSDTACWTFILSAPIDLNALQMFNNETFSLEHDEEYCNKLDLSAFIIIRKRNCPLHCELETFVSVDDGHTVLTTTFIDRERE